MRNLDRIAAEWKQTKEADRKDAMRRVATVLTHMGQGRFPKEHTQTTTDGETWKISRARYRAGSKSTEEWRLVFESSGALTLADATAWLLEEVQPQGVIDQPSTPPDERWRWVDGYERTYQVSNHGLVKSYHCRRVHPAGRLMKAFGGGAWVTLSKNSEPFTVRVAQLVDAAFPPPLVFATETP